MVTNKNSTTEALHSVFCFRKFYIPSYGQMSNKLYLKGCIKMKILVIQSDRGYLNRPETTKELMTKVVRDPFFLGKELIFMRLPKEFYVTRYDIYEGYTAFSWTSAAQNGGLLDLIKEADYVIIDSVYNPWKKDAMSKRLLFSEEAKNKVYTYRKFDKKGILVW